jgi:peptidoglycan-N-acetylglucosamine deacetylase
LKKLSLLVVSTGALVLVLAYGLGYPTATLLGPAVVTLPSGPEPRVALTFDDGPTEATGRILDVLKEKNVRATFFVCGTNAERRPDLVRRIRAEGHAIGNHTFSHPSLHLMSRARIAAELERTQDSLEKITGERPVLFRPPFGVRWFSLWPELKRQGMTMVMWSGGGPEGERDAGRIAAMTLENLKPGAIVLLHDGREAQAEHRRDETVKALPAIIDGIRKAGYGFAQLDSRPSPLIAGLARGEVAARRR